MSTAREQNGLLVRTNFSTAARWLIAGDISSKQMRQSTFNWILNQTNTTVYSTSWRSNILWSFRKLVSKVVILRAQELCESRGGRRGLPIPSSPYGLCRRNAEQRWTDLNWKSSYAVDGMLKSKKITCEEKGGTLNSTWDSLYCMMHDDKTVNIAW